MKRMNVLQMGVGWWRLGSCEVWKLGEFTELYVVVGV